ncbi:MAG: hypothetical protein RIS36_2377 [Pseudomonadota bacterium]|jgi:hypothetical protein
MKRFIAAVGVVVVAGVCGMVRAEAATPAVTKGPIGRCLFPSARTLSAVISNEATKTYLAQGYKQAFVGARILIKKPIVANLSKANVSGLSKIAPTAGNPAVLQITANANGAPIELGCNAQAEITTIVVLTDAAGARTNGRSVTKVTVQGVFQ